MATFNKFMSIFCIIGFLFLWGRDYEIEALASLIFAVLFKIDYLIDSKE